jgi:CheY-like chemotaxis protein
MTQIDVLYVEDNPDDADVFSRAVSKLDERFSFKILDNGLEAVQLLHNKKQYEGHGAAVPKMILLDLNLPGMSGHDILQLLRAHEKTRYVPVIVLSTSDHKNDIKKALDLGANAYVSKPVGYSRFVAALHQIFNFWLKQHQIPYQ